jgi:transcriptional regulator with XRE-family HTH domain
MANKLREIRFFKRVSQWQLRLPTGICQTRLSLIERGFIVPSDEDKRKIAEALGMTPEEIFPVDQ